MKKIFLFIIIIIFSKNTLAAQIYGLGLQGCVEYITHYNNSHQNYFNYKKDGQVTLEGKKIAEMYELQSYIDYFEGYASGFNASIDANLYKELDPRAIAIDLKNYCEKFPSALFIIAVYTVAKQYEK